jgi:Putative Ice-binding-like adhesive domain/PEP-CTERM motif
MKRGGIEAAAIALAAALGIARPANAMPIPLGDAANYAVIYEGSGGSIVVDNATINGAVGIGGTGSFQFSGPGSIGGNVDFAGPDTGQYVSTNPDNAGPTSVNYNRANITADVNDLAALSASLAGLGSSIVLNGTQTVDAASGQLSTINGVTYRIFNVTSYTSSIDSLLTINGDTNGYPVVFNFDSSSNVTLRGGVALNGLNADQILYNFSTAGQTVQLGPNHVVSFGSSPCCAPGPFQGIVLAVNDAVRMYSTTLDGRLFGGAGSGLYLTEFEGFPNTITPPKTPETTVPVGELPVAESINLSTSLFPSGDHLLSHIQSFLTQYGATLPPATETYINGTLPQVLPFADGAVDLKANATQSIVAFTVGGTGIDTAVTAAQLDDAASVGSFILSGFGRAVKWAFDVPDAINCSPVSLNCLAAYSLLTTDAALMGVGCALSGPFCVLGVASFVMNDILVPELHRFATTDPVDPNYASVFIPPATFDTPVFATGDPLVNQLGTNVVAKLELAGTYLLAANVSVDRYTSALDAQDASAAILQMQAILHYLALYDTAIKDARNTLSEMMTLPELNVILQSGISSEAFKLLQQELAANGFSQDEVAFFSELGLNASEITDLMNATLAYDASMDSNTVSMELVNINSALTEVSTDATKPVPEPGTASVLLGGLAIFFLVRRRRAR